MSRSQNRSLKNNRSTLTTTAIKTKTQTTISIGLVIRKYYCTLVKIISSKEKAATPSRDEVLALRFDERRSGGL